VFEGPVQDLIDELGTLPGIGPKSAQRIAFHLLAADPVDVTRLQEVLQRIKQGVLFCEVCGNVSEKTRCRYCSDARRDATLVCVVESRRTCSRWSAPASSEARYHVLGGALDPLAGVGPDQLRIRQLVARIGEPARRGRDGYRRDHHRHGPQYEARRPRPICPGCSGISRAGPYRGWPSACRWW